MHFEEYLVPYKWNSNWIEKKVNEMVNLMNQHEIPEPNESCKNCAYSEQYVKAVHLRERKKALSIQGTLFS